jgi:O-antigen ligase
VIFFYFLILGMPLSKHHFWAHFAGDFTGIKYVGLACLPYAMVRLSMRGSLPPLFATWQARFFLGLFFVFTLSYVTTPQVGSWTNSHWLTWASFLLLFFITVCVVDSFERLRWVLIAASSSLALASLYVLREWQVYHNMYKDFRPGWVVGDPNYFTVNVLLFIPTTFLLALQPRPRWQRWYCGGCFIVTLFGVWVSASRGGFLGILACSLCLILRSKQRMRYLVLIGTALVVVTVFSPVSPIQRFRNPSRGDQQSAETHVALMHGGVRMMLAHPLFGVGLDNFKLYITQYVTSEEAGRMDVVRRIAHNSYVEVGAEAGLPGLLLFVGMLLATLLSLEQVARRSKLLGNSTLTQIALGLQAGLVGSCVSIFFVSGEYQKMLWLAVFLTMCLPPLVDEVAAKRRALRRRAASQHSLVSESIYAVVPSPSRVSVS